MNLGEVFKRYLQENKTGQLVIRFEAEEYLCKVSVERGKAVYLSMGRMMPAETLQYIEDKVPLEINFIEGVNPIKKLATPLNAILLSIKGHEVKSTAKIENVKVNGKIPSQKVDALVGDFIDIVGPLGAAISESVLSRLGHAKGSGMSGDNYSVLLSSCLEELPEDERKQFKARHV